MEHLIQALVSLFAIANPIGVAPIFVSLVEGRTEAERRSIAVRTSASVFVILAVATHLQRLLSRRGQRVFLRFMGLILVAIGAQLLMGGIRDYFHA